MKQNDLPKPSPVGVIEASSLYCNFQVCLFHGKKLNVGML